MFWLTLVVAQNAISSDWVTVMRTLIKTGHVPLFNPPKNGQPRMLDLDEHTVALLAAHKKAQAELKMKNRTRYKDFGLVFAREWTDLTTEHNTLGLPLPFNTSGKGNTLASSRRVAFARSRSTRCDTRPRA